MKNKLRLLSLGLFVLLFLNINAVDAQFLRMENPEIGTTVKDFTLGSTNGESVSFNTYRDGQPTIIFFWATWCPHCRTALSTISEKAEELEANGVKMMLIDVGETKQAVEAYMSKRNLKMNVFLDDKTVVAQVFGVMGVPSFIYVNQEGVIIDIKHQLVDDYQRVLNKELK